MDLNSAQLLIAFLSGSLMATAISAFVKHCIIHPVISVRLDRKKGSYPTTEAVEMDEDGNIVNRFPAKFLRLHIENTGRSSIKDCSGYITKITKQVGGVQSKSEEEVIDLRWSHVDKGTRDIPRDAFFHMDVAALYLYPDGGSLQIAGGRLPMSLVSLVVGSKGTFELAILIAADNARPRRIPVAFTYDVESDELKFEPVNKARYPWWARWRWLRSKLTLW
jgi:hypothetical protein